MRVVLGWIALAIFIVGAAALLVAWAASLIPAGYFDQPANVWTVALVLGGSLGLSLLLNSSLSANPHPRPFIFDRGEARRGRVQINAGAIDFNISAHAADMSEILAGGQAAGGHVPRFAADGGEVSLSFPRRPLPVAGADVSEVTLSPNVPWSLAVKSGLGNIDLDLFELSIPSVVVHGGWGDIHLMAPAAGVTTASLTTWLGDARIEIPIGVAGRISAKTSRFAQIKVDERRWPRAGDSVWASPDYAAAAHKLSLDLKTTFGSISVS